MADLKLIKQLRESTGCGISDCNKALAECGDNLEKAVDWLRKKGLSAAVKKGGRVTSEGLVCVHFEGKKAVIAEINSETDFVARNDKFQEFAQRLTKSAIKFGSDLKALLASNFEGSSHSVEEEIKNKFWV